MRSFHHFLLIALALFPSFSREATPESFGMLQPNLHSWTYVDARRRCCQGLDGENYLRQKRLPLIPPDTANYCMLTLPSGKVILLKDQPDGTLLLNQDGCKIVQHDSSVLFFSRLNSPEDPLRTVFDEQFTLYVPPSGHLVLLMAGGPRIALEGESRIAFFPSDNYHQVKDHALAFSGEATFEFGDSGFSIVAPNLKLSGRANFQPGFLKIKDRSGNEGSVIENYNCNLSMTGYGTQTTIAPLTKTIFYGDEKSHFEHFESHAEHIYYAPWFECPEGPFNLWGKTAPMVLREFVKWYGLKGFACNPVIDTSKVELMGSGQLSKDMELCTFEHFTPSWGYRFGIFRDSIFISPVQGNRGLRRVDTKVNRFP